MDVYVPHQVDKVFLDTTYCKPEYDFPPQSAVIQSTVEEIARKFESRSSKQVQPVCLICVGSYTIGKERIFSAIAQHFDAKVWASAEKTRILKV